MDDGSGAASGRRHVGDSLMRRALKAGAVAGWMYIITGLASRFAFPDAPDWFLLSASTAGAAVLLIHLLELPLGFSAGRKQGIPRWKAVILTLIFGVIWMERGR